MREDLTITVDGVDAEDLVDWAGMQLSADPASFGARLLEWVAPLVLELCVRIQDSGV